MVKRIKQKKFPKGIVFFSYLKFFGGLLIIFYPFGFDSPWKELITIIGTLIILTSGVNIKFSNIFKDVNKP